MSSIRDSFIQTELTEVEVPKKKETKQKNQRKEGKLVLSNRSPEGCTNQSIIY